MRVVGVIFVFLGLVLCLTIIGAVFGVVLIFLGLLMIAFGGRRKTVINNVIQVTNSNGQQPIDSQTYEQRRAPLKTRTIAPTIAPMAPRISSLSGSRSAYNSTDEFEVEYVETAFRDARAELNQMSKRILGLAKQDGCEITARPDIITVRRGEYQEELRSNLEIETFGTTYGYL